MSRSRLRSRPAPRLGRGRAIGLCVRPPVRCAGVMPCASRHTKQPPHGEVRRLANRHGDLSGDPATRDGCSRCLARSPRLKANNRSLGLVENVVGSPYFLSSDDFATAAPATSQRKLCLSPWYMEGDMVCWVTRLVLLRGRGGFLISPFRPPSRLAKDRRIRKVFCYRENGENLCSRSQPSSLSPSTTTRPNLSRRVLVRPLLAPFSPAFLTSQSMHFRLRQGRAVLLPPN